MEKASLPADEEGRLTRLHSYNILDTLDEQEYDDIVHLVLELRRRTRQLEDLSEFKSRMPAVVAHDLRSPMAALSKRNGSIYTICSRSSKT